MEKKSSYLIEQLLKTHPGFDISKTYNHPFVDFKISYVGQTFEELMGGENELIPSIDTLYNTYISKYSNIISSKVSEDALNGRIARMWASLVREWHAYYLIKEIATNLGIKENSIQRNDDLDTYKGIDIYLYNDKNPSQSIKLDIYQSTGRAAYFRGLKDVFRKKDADVPGIKYQILIGKVTIPKYTKVVNNWYLLSDDAAERIANYFKKVLKES